MLTAARLYRLRLAETIAAGDVTPMMVFPIGEWHSARYPDLPLTEDLAHELIANFEAGILGTEPVVDSSGKHDTSAPAAGWVKKVYLASYEEGEVTGMALWADVEWTSLGATLLSDNQYKYGSVEIGPVTMNEGGDEVPNVLRSLTLTNTPVLRIMPGVKNAKAKQRVVGMLSEIVLTLSELTLGGTPDEAADDDENQADVDDQIGTLLAGLGERYAAGDDHAKAVMLTHLTALCDQWKTSEDPGPAKPGASRSEPDSQQSKTAAKGAPEDTQRLSESRTQEGSDSDMADFKNIAVSLGLSEEASEEMVLAEVQKRTDAAAESQKAARKVEATAKLDEAVRERHILPSQVDGLMALSESVPEAFVKFLADSEKVIVGPLAGEIGMGNREGKNESGDSELVGDPAKALAEARKVYMSEHGLKGAKGIDEADQALRIAKPQLYTEYAAQISNPIGAAAPVTQP
jgi:hypothetical protein